MFKKILLAVLLFGSVALMGCYGVSVRAGYYGEYPYRRAVPYYYYYDPFYDPFLYPIYIYDPYPTTTAAVSSTVILTIPIISILIIVGSSGQGTGVFADFKAGADRKCPRPVRIEV